MSDHSAVTDVYLHVGLPKTGTSYLQRCLWDSKAKLANIGILVPGTKGSAHKLGAWDLLGRRPTGGEIPEIPGSWQALVDEVTVFAGHSAVISHELLVHARPKDAKRVVHHFGSANLHLVLTVRDLGRTIGSSWQQQLAKGQSWPWDEYVAAVHEPDKWPATAGVAFWLRQDLFKILNSWDRIIPPSRIHIVTVPPPGAPVNLLLERFAAAVGIPFEALVASRPVVNPGVGAVEAEVLRQLNVQLGGRLSERQYTHIVQQAVRRGLTEQADPRPIRLNAGELDWVQERSRHVVARLADGGYSVTGDLEDLIPRATVTSDDPKQPVTDGEIAEATMRALVSVVNAYAEHWSRTRRSGKASEAPPAAHLASSMRAASFRARWGLLKLADRNKFVARAANRYLRRARER